MAGCCSTKCKVIVHFRDYYCILSQLIMCVLSVHFRDYYSILSQLTMCLLNISRELGEENKEESSDSPTKRKKSVIDHLIRYA